MVKKEELLYHMLDLENAHVVAVMGTGGKTTLIKTLARQAMEAAPAKKVLISPTTKIYAPEENEYHHLMTYEREQKLGRVYALPGITYAGVFFHEEGTHRGKLAALDESLQQPLNAQFELCLMEADGSKGKPLKAWRDDEPVLPQGCDHLIICVPVTVLGKRIDDITVHHLPLFLDCMRKYLNNTVSVGDVVDEVLLTSYLQYVRDHLGDDLATAHLCLFFNQVETEAQVKQVKEIFTAMEARKEPNFDMSKCFDLFAYGSAQLGVASRI